MESPVKLILGILGNAISVALFASPLPTFWNIYRKKSTQNFSAFPYVCALLNCLLWVLYGLPLVTEHALLVITINVAGCVFETSYIAVFLTYASTALKRKVLKVLAACLAAFVTVVVMTLTVVPKSYRKMEVGSLCVIVAIAMYVSPLSVMRLVIRTRSVQSMPLLLCGCVFLNSAIWTGYGVVAHDVFVLIPNAFGILAGGAQLTLHAVYHNAEPRDVRIGENDPKRGGASESATNVQMIVLPSMEKEVNGKQNETPPKDEVHFTSLKSPVENV